MVVVVDINKAMKDRLMSILGKHVKGEDSNLTDREFVRKVMERFEKHMDAYIVDVNE